MSWLHGLLHRLLILTVHLLSLSDRELLADRVKDLQCDEECVEIVVLKRAILIHVRLPGLLHILRWPELEQLLLDSLNASRFTIGTLAS